MDASPFGLVDASICTEGRILQFPQRALQLYVTPSLLFDRRGHTMKAWISFTLAGALPVLVAITRYAHFIFNSSPKP